MQEEEPTLTEILSSRGSSERRPDQLRSRIASNLIRQQRLTPVREQPPPPPPPQAPLPPPHTPPRPEIRVRNVGASSKGRSQGERGRTLPKGSEGRQGERGSVRAGNKKEDLQFMIEALIGRKLK